MGRKKRPRPPEVEAAVKELKEAQQRLETFEQGVQPALAKVQEARQALQQAEAELAKEEETLHISKQDVELAQDNLIEIELQQDNPWNAQYKKLKAYRDQHGHVRLPTRCTNDKELDKLCIWVNKQKQRHRAITEGKAKESKPYQMKALHKLGIEWTPRPNLWQKQFNLLLEFKERHGHTIVPQHYKENKNLALWVTTQRYDYKKFRENKKTFMSQERVDALNEIGFVWNVFDKKWREMYDKLVAQQQHRTPDAALSSWCARQRRDYAMYQNGQRESKKCQMTEERIQLLEKIGFEWGEYGFDSTTAAV